MILINLGMVFHLVHKTLIQAELFSKLNYNTLLSENV